MHRAQQFRQTYLTTRVIAAVLLLTVYSMGSIDPAGFKAVLAGKIIGSLGIVLAVKAVHVHAKQWRAGQSGAADS